MKGQKFYRCTQESDACIIYFHNPNKKTGFFSRSRIDSEKSAFKKKDSSYNDYEDDSNSDPDFKMLMRTSSD
jgi:hypothetical protein